MEQEETTGVNIGKGNKQGCCLSTILFNFYLNNEALEGVGNFRTEQITGRCETSR
jgi:hypothetical protein